MSLELNKVDPLKHLRQQAEAEDRDATADLADAHVGRIALRTAEIIGPMLPAMIRDAVREVVAPVQRQPNVAPLAGRVLPDQRPQPPQQPEAGNEVPPSPVHPNPGPANAVQIPEPLERVPAEEAVIRSWNLPENEGLRIIQRADRTLDAQLFNRVTNETVVPDVVVLASAPDNHVHTITGFRELPNLDARIEIVRNRDLNSVAVDSRQIDNSRAICRLRINAPANIPVPNPAPLQIQQPQAPIVRERILPPPIQPAPVQPQVQQPAPQPVLVVNPNPQEDAAAAARAAALAAEALFLRELPSLTIYTDCHEDSDGILARIVERVGLDGQIEKVIIGYYEVSGWWDMHRRWAFCPLPSGNVPRMQGGSLDSGIVNWRRDHLTGMVGFITGTHYWSGYSGVGGHYTTSDDKNGRQYILIPANGRNGFIGYVPARNIKTSLENNYLMNGDDYQLVCDNYKRLHLACTSVRYDKHGFELYGKIWWPVNLGAYEPNAPRLRAQENKIDQEVREYHLRNR